MDRIDAKRTRFGPVLVILTGLVVLAVMLFQVPLATVFTLGLLLVCPLLMAGMHGGGHANHADQSRGDRGARSQGRESS